MTRFIYTLALRLLAPVIWLWMARRARRSGPGTRVLAAERFGRYGEDAKPFAELPVWVHAVSLGEVRAAQPLVTALLEQGYSVLLTHMTLTGRQEGERAFADAIKKGSLHQTWLPYDFPASVRRFLVKFRPRCGILIEREVWPNLIAEARQLGMSMLLVSARFSDASLRQTRWAKRLFRQAYAALDLVLAQTSADAERLKQVGAHGPHVVGNLKFDVIVSSSQIRAGQAWKAALGKPVVALASTRDGEEEMLLSACQRLLSDSEKITGGKNQRVDAEWKKSDVLYLIVPRHPQRFDVVADLLAAQKYRFARRSESGHEIPQDIDIYLGDSLGEMFFYYGACDVAIIGGGFAQLGGQNLIEACAAGTPVIVGPNMFNFSQATADAVAARAAIQVNTADEAMEDAMALINDHPRRERMRQAASDWAAAHAGATSRTMTAIRPWLDG